MSNVFEKLRFHNGLVWTVGLTVKIKFPRRVDAASGVNTGNDDSCFPC